MVKRLLSMALCAVMVVSLMSGITFTAMAEDYVNQSHMLKVKGNKIVWEDDETVQVVLSGVNVPGGEWTGTPESEKLERNIQEAMHNWNCNFIRLAVGTKGWNGGYEYGTADSYRSYIRKVISYAEKAGKYVILDLHEYGSHDATDLAFWKEAATIYKNNPTVLFGILNEPTPSSWEIWRDGDSSGKIGHQQIVEAIRDLGARNIIVAGGRSYAKNTSGVVNGYALVDQNSKGEKDVGNGIMYDTHWYAWHGYTNSWNNDIGPTRMAHPMVMGEFGWDAGLNLELGKKTFNPGDEQYHDKWFTHLMNFFEDYETYDNYMNFTAYSFHPSSAPAMLKKTDDNGAAYGDASYAFSPTEYHGAYIKDMLNTRMRNNVAKKAKIVDQSSGRPVSAADAMYAVDDDITTAWSCNRSGSRYFTVDLGTTYKVTRYIARLGGTGEFKNAQNFTVYFSKDNVNWTKADEVTGNESPVVDRYITPASARYIKFDITTVAEGNAVASVYDFRVVGEISDGLDTVEITAPKGFDVTEHIVAKNQIINFAAGQTADDWTKAGYVVYRENMAEDGVSPALELSGLFGDTQVFGCSGAGTFGAFRDFDAFRFKYKADKAIDFQISLHYRATNREYLTNKITFPATNGEWSTIVITPEDLMPSASDTWVKTDMNSKYNSTYKNYEPVVKLQFTGGHNFDEPVYFEKFEAVWYGTADYSPSYMSVKGGIKDGVVEVATRWQNNGGKIEDLFNFICLFDGDGTLVEMVTNNVDLPANSLSTKNYLTLPIPEGITDLSDYYIKTYTWRDGVGCRPVCETVTIDADGNVTYN